MEIRREVEFDRKKSQMIEQKGYLILDPLGNRQNTLITLAFDSKHNISVVLKEIHIQTDLQAQSAFNEIRILSSINSEYVAKYIDHFTFEKKIIFIVQEYVEGVDLFKRIKARGYQQLSEPDIQKIFIQILLGLQYLHSVNIIHGDVRLESIVLQQSNDEIKCKFVSLEFSRFDTENQIARQNLLYTSPETLKDGIMGYKSDLWQLGCLFYQLQMGVYPFYDEDEGQIQNLIKSGQFNDAPNVEFNEILKLLLHPLPEKRPECIEILNSFFEQRLEQRLDYRARRITKRNPISFDEDQIYQDQQQQNVINYNHRARINQPRPLNFQPLPINSPRPFNFQPQPFNQPLIQPHPLNQPQIISQQRLFNQRQRLNTQQSVGVMQQPIMFIPMFQIQRNCPFYVIDSTRRR
ncbi:hypothetical protein pb186bvf_012882 [Paramecium bursaria]